MSVPWWGWLATLGAIGLLLAADTWHARRPHEVGFGEALTWSLVYIGTAVGFGAGLYAFGPEDAGTSFFAGYLVEKSLSVDNLFVFAVIMNQFSVPARHRQRALLIGVQGALVMRAAFIAAGAVVIERFTVVFVIFGAFLLYSAVRLVQSHGDAPDVGDNRAVRLLRRVMPVTAGYEQEGLVVRAEGRRAATPLLVVVVAILSVDVLFAMDSIPAIFGITRSAYLVFAANAFALLGLRALYFLIVGLLDRLVHLHYGLAAVLAFIGVKLVLHYAHSLNQSVPEISTGVSLVVVAGALALTTVTSLRSSRPSRPASGTTE